MKVRLVGAESQTSLITVFQGEKEGNKENSREIQRAGKQSI